MDWTPSGDWPSNAPSLEISEEALLAGMDLTPPPFPALGAIAIQVAGALSDLEVKAIARAKLEFDGTPLRRAAAMRVRVGFALATAPPRGSTADPTAVATLLGEIDEILSEVNALAESAPAERAVGLGASRNALVKEAIDFSEVAQRYVVRDADPIPAAPRKPAKAAKAAKAAPAPRVLSVRSEPEPGPVARSRLLLVAVAVAALVAVAYHGYRYLQRRDAAEVALKPLLVPAPAGYRGLNSAAGGPTVLQPTGEPVDRAGVEKFKSDEKAKGNEVIELPSGALLVQPGAAKPQ
jgi:hypothetical protein